MRDWESKRLASTRDANERVRKTRFAAIRVKLTDLGWSRDEIYAIANDKRVREAKPLTEKTWTTLCVSYFAEDR